MSADSPLGPALLALARAAIERDLSIAQATAGTSVDTAAGPILQAPGASFVTLTQQGRLRGCIGSLEAWRPLAVDVEENACAAAFRDPRFPPLAADELPQTRVEVSLLTPARRLAFASEDEALAQLRPNVDGVILECAGRRATFLPQVWEQLPMPRDFLARLKEKAGLPAAFWDSTLRLSTYRVEKWKDA